MTTETPIQTPRDPGLEGIGAGRIVHVFGWDTRTNGDPGPRAAIIVRDWGERNGSCNLMMFPDGSNDIPNWDGKCVWLTSVPFGPSMAGKGYTGAVWYWPERK